MVPGACALTVKLRKLGHALPTILHKAEVSTAHRNGTFKIEKSFDEALDTILKVKPAPKAAKTDKK